MKSSYVKPPTALAASIAQAHVVGVMFPVPGVDDGVEARIAAALEAERIALDAERVAAAGLSR